MEVTKSFMIDKTTGVCSGTLFIIKDTVCGCDVQPFSFMPKKGKTATQLKTTTIASQCFVFVIVLNRDTS